MRLFRTMRRACGLIPIGVYFAAVVLAHAAPPRQRTTTSVWVPPVPNLLSDSSFESPPLSNGWAFNSGVFAQGVGGQSVNGVHSGHYSLRLLANALNTSSAPNLFGIGQNLAGIQNYFGKQLYFSGWLMATDGATASLRLSAISSTGAIYWRELQMPDSGAANPTPVFREDVLDIPNDPTIQAIVLTCTVETPVGSAYFDDLVVSGDIPTAFHEANGDPDPGPDLSASVAADASQVVRSIPRTLYGTNTEWLWDGDGIWNASTGGPDSTLLNLGSSGGISLLRFPGGFFSDFYHWQDAIGPQADRAPAQTLPGSTFSPTNFGTDEAIQYASSIGAQLMITVNVQTGTPEEAAAWVAYVNNGQRRVDYWEIGNELYVDPRVFDPTLTPYTPTTYANRFLEYAKAMRAVDPTIKLGASMDFNYGLTTYHAFQDWTQTVLSIAGSQIDFAAVHNGFAPVLPYDSNWNVRMVYASMLGASSLVDQNLQQLGSVIDTYAGANAPNISIGATEWGPLFATDASSSYIDHLKTLGSALYAATILRSLISNPRTQLANAFKEVDSLGQGWIGLRNGQYVAKPVHLAMGMFANYFGTQLISSTVQSPTYETRSIGWVDGQAAVPYLESVSSLNDDGSALTVMAINKHFDRNIDTSISLANFCATGDATIWTLTGTAIDANPGTQIDAQGVTFAPQAVAVPDGRFNDGGPGEISLTSTTLSSPGASFTYILPPHSVVSISVAGHTGACQ